MGNGYVNEYGLNVMSLKSTGITIILRITTFKLLSKLKYSYFNIS